MNIYTVGAMSDQTEVAAPNAATAAMYYALKLINTNAPTWVVVYTENGQQWEGDSYWLCASLLSTDEQDAVLKRLHDDIADNMQHAAEMLWWVPEDGTDPVYAFRGMYYRGQLVEAQCKNVFRDETRALREALAISRALSGVK